MCSIDKSPAILKGSKGGDDLPYPSHLMSSSIASWQETQGTESSNKTNPVSAQPPNSVPVFYRASWLHSGVQPLPSANHLQLRNNGLIPETITLDISKNPTVLPWYTSNQDITLVHMCTVFWVLSHILAVLILLIQFFIKICQY